MAVVKDVTVRINVKDDSIKNATKSFDKLNKEISEQEGLLGKLQKKEEALIKLRKRSSDPKAIKAFNRELESTRKEIGKLTTVAKKQEIGMSNLNKSIIKVGASLGAAFAIKAAVSDAIKRIVGFEKSISSLSAITGATGKDLEKLKGIVLQTAKDTKKSGQEIAKAFELVGSAQPQLLKNADALALVTKNAIILSKASGLELTEAVAATTTGLAQFNIAAAASAIVIDSLAAGAKFGASAIPETTAAIEKFGAVANNANISIADSVALTETLATKQLTGAEAGNNLKNIILKLQNAGLGFVDGQFNINAALEETRAKFDSIEDPVKRSQAQTKLFGLESATAGQILLDNIGTFEDFSKSIGDDVGGALIQAGIQMDNVAGKVEELDATYDSFILSIEDGSGVISNMAESSIDSFTQILESLTELNEFDFQSLFNPDNMRDFSNESLDLAKSIGGVLDPNIRNISEIIDTTYNTKLDAANNKLKELTTEQLENGRVVSELVKIYAKQGISQQDAVNKIREELSLRGENTNNINSESTALDKNTTATNDNSKSKEKSLSFFDRLKAKAKETREFLDEQATLDTIFTDDTSADEEPGADFEAFVEAEQKKVDAKEAARREDRENQLVLMDEIAVSEQEAKDAEFEADQERLRKEDEEHQLRIQRNTEIAQSAADLAGALSSLAKKGSAEAKAFASVQVIINGAVAIVQALAQLGPIAGALAAAGIVATTAVQLQKINSAKALKDGEIMISGAGTETSDSIPAMLSVNESVINAKESKKNHVALKAINDGRFDEYLNRIVMQRLYTGKSDRSNVVINKSNPTKFPDSFSMKNARSISNPIVKAIEDSNFLTGAGWV